MKKNIAWIDTIRVLASFLVIFCHFFMCEGFLHETRMNIRLYEFAILCISLFFAISGYLIHPSLERKTSLKDYYKKKLVRIVVPFTVCYIVMSAGMTVLSLFDEKIVERVPLYHALFGAKYFALLLGMFPVDLNVTKFLGWDVDWFIGEWFMGTIVWMYLLSPILDKGAVRAPILSLAASIAISFAAFHATAGWAEQGLIHGNWALFLVRIPEFLFGMILFIHREKLLQIRRYLVPGLCVYMAIQIAYFIYTYPEIGAIFFSNDPTCFATTLPAIYLVFTAVERLNEHNSKFLDWFNSFNGISYMAMLSQHMIIYLFCAAINFGDLHSFGRVYLLLVITWVIVVVSKKLQECSAPVEKWFLKKREAA